MNHDEQLNSARKAIREALVYAHRHSYQTKGQAWRQILASLAFETKAELSLIQYFDEQDQARFAQITQAVIDGVIPVGDLVNHRDYTQCSGYFHDVLKSYLTPRPIV